MSEESRENIRQALTDQLGTASNRVQLILSRGSLPAWASGDDAANKRDEGSGHERSGPRRRMPVGVGAHPEVDVVAEGIRLWGRIDLVSVENDGVTVTDYKSGLEDPSHDEQVRLYALLWDLDRQTNPKRRAVTTLLVSYPARDRVVPVPDDAALRSLEAAMTTRIEAADAETASTEPRALPSAKTCGFCRVRHLCGEYWTRIAPEPATVPSREWFDLEGRVLRQNGIKSWVVEPEQGDTAVLVRTLSPSNALPVGQRIRVLGVRKVEDPDNPELVIAAMGSGSETYVLTDANS